MSKHQLQLATKVCALFSSEFSSINARLVSCYFSPIFILFQPLVLRLRFVIRHLYTWGMNESWNKPTDVNEKKTRKCQQSSMENFAVFFFFWFEKHRDASWVGQRGLVMYIRIMSWPDAYVSSVSMESKSRERWQVAKSVKWTQTVYPDAPATRLASHDFVFFCGATREPSNGKICSNASSSHAYAIYCMIHMNV